MSRPPRRVSNGFNAWQEDVLKPAAEYGIHAVAVSTAVRPGRGRSRAKTELDEKIKKPVDGVRKKVPPARKAPSRGRYVDEYARPAI